MKSTFQKTVSLISSFFILLFLLAALNRAGSLILLWKEEPLGSITHDTGYGYYAFVRDENISRLGLPFYLKEDETLLSNPPLSVNEDITATIKDRGLGAHKIMENNDLYFSASDNRPENHEYSIISPAIIRNRYLLVLFCLAALSAAVLMFHIYKSKDKKAAINPVRFGTILLFMLMLLPWDLMIFSSAPKAFGSFLLKPLLQRNLIFICLLFVLLLLNTLFAGKSRFLAVLAAAVLVVSALVSAAFWFALRKPSGSPSVDDEAYFRGAFSAEGIFEVLK